jgi:ribosomal protein S17E
MATLSEKVTAKKILRRGPSKFKGAASPAPVAIEESEFPEEPEVIEMPSVGIIKKEDALTAPQYAKTLTVTDQPTLDTANEFLKNVKAIAAKVADSFDPQISQAHALHKSLIDEKKKFTAPLEEAEKIVKRSIAGYLYEEDRKRREVEAERARIEAEARAEAEKKMKAVEKAEAKGDTAKAESIAQDAVNVMTAKIDAAPVIPDAPQAAGLSLTENWKFEIVDAKAIPREYLSPDEVKIGRIVRALKSEAKIPGVRIWSEKSLSARTF